MSWVRIDDQFPDHPKIVAAGPDGAWLFVAGLCYCARYLTDGVIPADVVPRLTALPDPKQTASKLVQVCLWHASPDGSFLVHDYLDYNPSREDALKVRAVRAEAGKLGGERSGAARSANKRAQEAAAASKREANTEANGEANAKQNGSKNEPRTPSPEESKDSGAHAVVAVRKRRIHAPFVIPERDAVAEYMVFKGGTITDADCFFDNYTANGWMIGKTEMRDWRAAANNWLRRKPLFANGNGASPRPAPKTGDIFRVS